MRKRILMTLFTVVLMLGLTAGVAYAAPGDLKDTLVTTDADNDNGLANANLSGLGAGGQNVASDVIKSQNMTNQAGDVVTQRSHGDYQNNTNSCASCHQTHTGAAKGLLFKDGVYTTCTACHDGTLGFYNVFTNGNHQASAGTFGGSEEGNSSVHMSNGTMTTGAAPGGSSSDTQGGDWAGEFNCASCHAPHGSFSDRLLHYNPNNMAATAPAGGGLKLDRSAVINYADLGAYFTSTAANTPLPKLVAVRGTRANHGLTATTYDYIGTDLVIMVYERTSTTYTKTTNPWMYGYPVRGSGTNSHYYYSRFFTADPTTILNANGTYPTAKAAQVYDYYDYTAAVAGTPVFKLAKGLIYGTEAEINNLTYAEIARTYVVKLDLMPINTAVPELDSDSDGFWDTGGMKITTVNQRALYAGETNVNSVNIASRWGVATPGTTKVSGWGIAMSTWCSSCHVDYLAKSGTATGTFSTSYRHTTTSDSYTCVRCHFAHGTDVEIMVDAQFRTIAEVVTDTGLSTEQATDYMLDTNPSSALKRFTNMSVCWSCHTSSSAESLKNNDSYSYDPTNPNGNTRGIPATEGKQNWPQ